MLVCTRAAQLLESIDSLVKEQLPSRAPCLANVRERSDAMMAIYPGRGSRFAKHIGGLIGASVQVGLWAYGGLVWCARELGVLTGRRLKWKVWGLWEQE